MDPSPGLIVGPIALVLRALAFKLLNQNPKLPGKAHAIAALVNGRAQHPLEWGGRSDRDCRRCGGAAVRGAMQSPTHRNEHPTAIAAYYTGIFALFPGTGLFMGPAALWLGIKALSAIRGEPGSGGKTRAIAAVVLGAITTVLNWGAVLFFLLARASGRF